MNGGEGDGRFPEKEWMCSGKTSSQPVAWEGSAGSEFTCRESAASSGPQVAGEQEPVQSLASGL